MNDNSSLQRAAQAAREPVLVETVEALNAAAREWSRGALLAVDTEFVRETTYRAALGLVQVSEGETVWLLDPLKIDLTEALKDLFRNGAIIKVFHSASEDLEVFHHLLGIAPAPFIDTQIAAALTGEPLQLSLHAALRDQFGIELNSEQTRSDWLSRPLQLEQLRYAASDVTYLPALYHEYQRQLIVIGRWPWLEEDCAILAQSAAAVTPPERMYLRIPGAGGLQGPQLLVLKQLAAWREELAVAGNVARRFVVPDAALLAIATCLPASRPELQAINELRSSAVRRHGQAILDLVRTARGSADRADAVPSLKREDRTLLGRMRALVADRAKVLGLEPAVLASRRALEQLIVTLKSGAEVPERLLGWRRDVFTDDLLKMASGFYND